MTKNTTRAITFLTAAALLATTGVVSAQPPDVGGRMGPHGAMSAPGWGLLQGPLGDRLDLSDEQRGAIGGILERHREAAQPWHDDLRGLGAELETAIEAEPFDEEAVRALAQRMADIRVELAVSRARTGQEIREVLTPDQRETLGELKAQRREMRAGVRGPGGRGFHRRGPRG